MPQHRKLPITVIIPTRNEAANLAACLSRLKGFDQVVIVDSQSGDDTTKVAHDGGAEVHQFHYRGGWPKKRQWALENLEIRNPWTLLLDADECMTSALESELRRITAGRNSADGYWISMRLVFLGGVLRHGASNLKKLSLFRTGKGRFECLVANQTMQMSDVEIHEHVIVDGREGNCRSWLLHHNVNSLFRYIEKHNEYSTWSAAVATRTKEGANERRGSLRGTQADQRRWITKRLWKIPAGGLLLPLLRFGWFYFIKLGFLDGIPGYYYCGFKAVQSFHIMAKVRESSIASLPSPREKAGP
ncbi:glycosyltransferase family 2 protein [Candidatus Sumerlaeota bacterium]|nr:glycosyltransferase family 2 protein [Candidatus Sumerlaeota bacterium]